MAYFFLQLWMIFFIHPLTILIVPTTLGIYAVLCEEKRIKAKYGLAKTKRVTASHGLGVGPEPLLNWEVERAVEEYERLLKENKKTEKKVG